MPEPLTVSAPTLPQTPARAARPRLSTTAVATAPGMSQDAYTPAVQQAKPAVQSPAKLSMLASVGLLAVSSVGMLAGFALDGLAVAAGGSLFAVVGLIVVASVLEVGALYAGLRGLAGIKGSTK